MGNGNPSNGSGRRRTTPARFPPELWIVHAVTLNDGHRTNNVAEGCSNRLRNLVGHHHPSVCGVLSRLCRSTLRRRQQYYCNMPSSICSRLVVVDRPSNSRIAFVTCVNSTWKEHVLWRISFVLWVMACAIFAND